MLKKLVSIRNVGTFRNYVPGGDVELRKLTLVHAENGRGKTTLCAILRSLQSGDPTPILERKTLDSLDAPYVKVLTSAGSIEFKSGSWASTCQQIELFDAEFVAANVYSGDAITHDHKKNLCRVVLGSEGVKLAKAYDDLDAAEREAQNKLNAARTAAQRHVPAGFALDAFVDLVPAPEVDRKLAEKQAEAALVSDSDNIKRAQTPDLIRLAELPPNMTMLLAKTLDGVSADAERRVEEHAKKHGIDSRRFGWLADGVSLATGPDCPFCDQSLAGSTVIDSLKTYFSQAYRAFGKELSTLLPDIESALGDDALMALQRVLTTNETAFAFWGKHVKETPPSLDFDHEVRPVMVAARNELKSVVHEKLAAPLSPVSLGNSAQRALTTLTDLRAKLDAYNARIAKYTQAILMVKSGLDTKDAVSIQAEIARFESIKKRADAIVVASLVPYVEAKLKKAEIEAEKEKAKATLDEYNSKVINAYQLRVNDWLQRFAAGFRLNKVKIEYTGRTPRAAYVFQIRGTEVDPGGNRTPSGVPCFRNTLSAGDRNTLALAFFISQVESRSDLSDLIIVFDDPFTSLDAYRQRWTCNAIRKLSRKAKQVIVLSHSFGFLKLVSERCDSGTLKGLQIDRQNLLDSHIVELNLDDTIDVVEADLVTLRSFHHGDHKNSEGTIRCIRPLLENHIRKMAPDDCPQGDGWLGGFLGNIRVALPGTPLAQFQPVYDDLDYLNSYTSEYHHDSGKAKPINDAELTQACELTLKLINRL